jgi:hypothetical protein
MLICNCHVFGHHRTVTCILCIQYSMLQVRSEHWRVTNALQLFLLSQLVFRMRHMRKTTNNHLLTDYAAILFPFPFSVLRGAISATGWRHHCLRRASGSVRERDLGHYL